MNTSIVVHIENAQLALRPVAGDPNAYETESEGTDYHVRFENGGWCVDAFDSSEPKADAAHLTSAWVSTLEEAAEAILNREFA